MKDKKYMTTQYKIKQKSTESANGSKEDIPVIVIKGNKVV